MLSLTSYSSQKGMRNAKALSEGSPCSENPWALSIQRSLNGCLIHGILQIRMVIKQLENHSKFIEIHLVLILLSSRTQSRRTRLRQPQIKKCQSQQLPGTYYQSHPMIYPKILTLITLTTLSENESHLSPKRKFSQYKKLKQLNPMTNSWKQCKFGRRTKTFSPWYTLKQLVLQNHLSRSPVTRDSTYLFLSEMRRSRS